MTRQTIEQIAIPDLRPWARNARTHSKKQLRQIADSIEALQARPGGASLPAPPANGGKQRRSMK